MKFFYKIIVNGKYPLYSVTKRLFLEKSSYFLTQVKYCKLHNFKTYRVSELYFLDFTILFNLSQKLPTLHKIKIKKYVNLNEVEH